MKYFRIKKKDSDLSVVFEVSENGVQAYYLDEKGHCFQDLWHEDFEDAIIVLIREKFVKNFLDFCETYCEENQDFFSLVHP